MKKCFKIVMLNFIVSLSLIVSSCSNNTVGIVKLLTHPSYDAVQKGIQDELSDLKMNVKYNLLNAEGNMSAFTSLANKLQSSNTRVAVGISSPVSHALVTTLKNIPVVFTAVTDPVRDDLVASLTKGEKNVTGVSDMIPAKAQMQILARILKIKRLGHVYTDSDSSSAANAYLASVTCKELGIEFVQATVSAPSDVRKVVASIINRVDAIYVSMDRNVSQALPAVADETMKKKIPVFSVNPDTAQDYDVLAAWGTNFYKMGRAAGKLVSEILKGKKPEEFPTLFLSEIPDVDLLINLDTAKKLGITIPDDILKNASKIIENGKLTLQ